MSNRNKSWRNGLIVVGLVALLSACNESDQPANPGPVPTPAPTPTPTPSSQVVATGTFTIIRNQLGIADFTTDRQGTLDVEIGYLHDDSDLLFWVTDRQCTRWQFERDECFYLVKSLAGPNPRHMTATGVPAGTYTLFAANDTKRVEETMTWEITLTPQ